MFATLRCTCPMRVSGFTTRRVCFSVSMSVTPNLELAVSLILPPPAAGVDEEYSRERYDAAEHRRQRGCLAGQGDEVRHHRNEVEEAHGPRGVHAGHRPGVGDGSRGNAEVDHRERSTQGDRLNLRARPECPRTPTRRE